MSSYALRLNKIEYVNDVVRDEFFSASNANVLPKLFLYFLEAGVRSSGNIFKISNRTLMNLMHASEREIQYILQQLEDLGFITIKYEKERASKKGVEARNVGKRLGIFINVNEMLQYTNISRYDDEYKNASKRGWLRRIINQIPVRIIGFFNHAIAMAKKMNDHIKLEAIRKRQENYDRHIKAMQKRHKSYKSPEADEDVPMLEVYKAIEETAVYGLRLRRMLDPEAAVKLSSRSNQN
ncbi:MAG TPA: hypothetical protein PLP48_08935 [Acholeplasmataceae bacterium]|nr:hypothetical protein [Acholeplasmataceae bacterium]